eukprot:scaffold24_cov128-Cylindrotheca_fusiformis.AAC.14
MKRISYGMIPEEACAQLIFGEIFCCPEEDQPSCFLCGAEGVSYDADKNFDGTNCGDLNTKMKLNPRQKSCSAWTEYYTTKGDVNVRSLCECDGAQPVNQCNICGNGEIFAEAMVPDEGMTCGELIEYSKHVVSAERCSSISTREIKNVCCGGSRAALSMTLLGVALHHWLKDPRTLPLTRGAWGGL